MTGLMGTAIIYLIYLIYFLVILFNHTQHNTSRLGRGVFALKTMDIHFTEAWYSPKSK